MDTPSQLRMLSITAELEDATVVFCRVPGGPCLGQGPVALAGIAPSATVAVGNAGEVKATRGDGHTLTAEDAANGSGGGGSNSGVLWEGAEDGSGQGHHHGRGLDDNGGVLALP
ncbi:hypothetical protein CIB84_016013, partial [Bambusicola thoracicus]